MHFDAIIMYTMSPDFIVVVSSFLLFCKRFFFSVQLCSLCRTSKIQINSLCMFQWIPLFFSILYSVTRPPPQRMLNVIQDFFPSAGSWTEWFEYRIFFILFSFLSQIVSATCEGKLWKNRLFYSLSVHFVFRLKFMWINLFFIPFICNSSKKKKTDKRSPKYSEWCGISHLQIVCDHFAQSEQE